MSIAAFTAVIDSDLWFAVSIRPRASVRAVKRWVARAVAVVAMICLTIALRWFFTPADHTSDNVTNPTDCPSSGGCL
jgi:hypothetical protein